ncbi:MAG: hypothetical protein IKT40_07430 [Bacilli bacterium]|nr:hypothetical protein [Bacilli bacterium]
MNKVVRIEESEIKNIIESVVNDILSKNAINEDFRDTAKSFASQYANRASEKAKQFGDAAKEKVKKGVDTVKSTIDRVKNADVKSAVRDAAHGVAQDVANDVRGTWNNAKQDSYAKDMRRAFEAFKDACRKFEETGGQLNHQFQSRIQGLENMLNAYAPHA